MNAAVTSFGHSALYILQMLKGMYNEYIKCNLLFCWVYWATVLYYVIVISVK